MRSIVEGGGLVGCRRPSRGLYFPLAFLTLTMLMAGSATGQTVATSFEQLRFKVKAGDTIFVTDDSGTSERKLEFSISRVHC